jgi:hypothetical protein
MKKSRSNIIIKWISNSVVIYHKHTSCFQKGGHDTELAHPLMMETEKIVDKVRKPVRIFCCLHIRMTAEELNMDQETDKS